MGRGCSENYRSGVCVCGGIVWGYDLPSLLLGPLSLYYRLTAPSYFCDRFVLYQACQLDALPMTSVWCSPHSPQIYHQSQVILSMLGRLGARCSVHWSTNCTQAPTVNAGSGHTHVAQGLFAVIIAMAKIGPRPLRCPVVGCLIDTDLQCQDPVVLLSQMEFRWLECHMSRKRKVRTWSLNAALSRGPLVACRKKFASAALLSARAGGK